MAASSEGQGRGPDGAGGAVLDERYELLPGRRLPELDSPHAEAFEVHDLRSAGRSLFALICRRDLLPRAEALTAFERLERSGMVKPLGWGAVDWAPDGGSRFALVLERPGGARVLAEGAPRRGPMRPDHVKRKVVRPLVPLLRELSHRVMVHRAIRIENLFYTDASGSEVMLGECVSAPAGLAQPTVYETIENGMANPSGRGLGAPADDLYSFGVLLVDLLSAGQPCAGMSDREIVAAKLKTGSFGALVGQSRFAPELMEPLRGLLHDDPRERWSAQDLEFWADGRSLSSKQPVLPPKATRPYSFAGEDYWDTRSLAHAMANDWAEALRAVREEQLVEWVRRSLSDEAQAESITKALRLVQSAGGGEGAEGDDWIVSRVLMALDPKAPIRYRDFAAHINTLGRSLAINYHDDAWRKLFVTVMNGRLPLAWFDAQVYVRSEYVPLKKLIEQAALLLSQVRLGRGIERCLYQLNPGWPCLSPMLRRHYVQHIRDLLPALESLAQKGAPAAEPVDAHIAAFCTARLKDLSDRVLNDLASDDRTVKYLAMLHVLATVQQRTGPDRTPHLARWFAGLLSPSIENFHNRRYRRELTDEVARLVGQGLLGELCDLFDNEAAWEADERGFAMARAQYRHCALEVTWLEQGGLTSRENVMRGSRQAASLISAVMSGVLAIALTLFYVI